MSLDPPTTELGFRPLYKQVRDELLRRLSERVWTPGQALPSEIELAAELGVSQGTVRKALDELAHENLVVRRQGRGTFVAEHDDKRVLFQFFRLTADDGAAVFPESRVLSVSRREATKEEAGRLALEKRGAHVVVVERARSLDGRPVIAERVVLPDALFPGLADEPIPNNLYGLFAARFGVTVARAQEKLKAAAAGRFEAEALGVPRGTPLIAVDRVAFSIDGLPVEWRRSLCLTDKHHYRSDLR